MFAMPAAWRLAGLGLGFLTPVVGRSRRGFGGFAFALGDATWGRRRHDLGDGALDNGQERTLIKPG
jgi:hypothetical protein